MAAVTLKVKIQEDIILNNQDYSSKRTLEIENVNEIVKRVVTASTTESGLVGFLSALSNVGVTANKVGYLAGMFDDGDVRYMRITNLDDSNHITLTFRDEDNTEYRIKVDAGHSYIYPGDNSDGVVDTMKAGGSALSSGLSDLVDITIDADTSACDVEVFVASA